MGEKKIPRMEHNALFRKEIFGFSRSLISDKTNILLWDVEETKKDQNWGKTALCRKKRSEKTRKKKKQGIIKER